VFRRFLNRLIGRTDMNIDAVNAFVEGNASPDETRIVEELIRLDPSLERNLSTQQGLLEVMSRIDKVEAPRSFAVTPEMVAAAEQSESGFSRLAQLFAPQRKLALAPAVIAGIAALSVALLTVGDITGVVEQSEARRDAAFTNESSIAAVEGAISIEESQTAAGGGASSSLSLDEDDLEDSSSAMDAVAESAPASGAPSLTAPTAAPAATAAQSKGSAEIAGDGAASVPQPELAELAPIEAEAAEEPALSAEAPSDDSERTTEQQLERSGDFADSDADSDDGAAAQSGESRLAYGQPVSELPGAQDDDGISLPLWQLQVALAALAVAAIGAWAGLRRVRGE